MYSCVCKGIKGIEITQTTAIFVWIFRKALNRKIVRKNIIPRYFYFVVTNFVFVGTFCLVRESFFSQLFGHFGICYPPCYKANSIWTFINNSVQPAKMSLFRKCDQRWMKNKSYSSNRLHEFFKIVVSWNDASIVLFFPDTKQICKRKQIRRSSEKEVNARNKNELTFCRNMSFVWFHLLYELRNRPKCTVSVWKYCRIIDTIDSKASLDVLVRLDIFG